MKMFHLDKISQAGMLAKSGFRGVAMLLNRFDAVLPGLDSHGVIHTMREGGIKK